MRAALRLLYRGTAPLRRVFVTTDDAAVQVWDELCPLDAAPAAPAPGGVDAFLAAEVVRLLAGRVLVLRVTRRSRLA